MDEFISVDEALEMLFDDTDINDSSKIKRLFQYGVFQVSCRIKLNFMPPALLLFSLDLNLLH